MVKARIMLTSESIRSELAKAYQIIAMLGWDDATYTHLTHRHPTEPHFYIQPFGLLFEEVDESCLVEMDFSGNLIAPKDAKINQTGHAIHSAIYQARPEIQAVFHLHTPESIAVSACPQGILPISQHAYHFYERVGYFDYDALTLHQNTQGKTIANQIHAHVPIIMLRNHGTIVCGRTVQEAFFYQYHLQKACEIQCLLDPLKAESYVRPSHDVCRRAQKDILNFEKDLGLRDWQAFSRKLARKKAFLKS